MRATTYSALAGDPGERLSSRPPRSSARSSCSPTARALLRSERTRPLARRHRRRRRPHRERRRVGLRRGRAGPRPAYRPTQMRQAALDSLARRPEASRAFGRARARYGRSTRDCARCSARGRRSPVVARTRRETPLAPFVALLALAAARAARCGPVAPWRSTIDRAMTRGLRRSKVLGPLMVVLLAALALVSAGAGTSASSDERRLGRLRQHAERASALAADADRQEQRRQPRTRRHGRLPRDRRGVSPRRAVVPGRRERNDVRHDERRQRLGARRDERQGQVALAARQRRRLQELRHRREPRRRPVRRQALHPHARHDDRLAQPGGRIADQARRDRARRCRARRRTTATRRRARRSARTTASSSAPPARSTACAASRWRTTPISRRRGRIPSGRSRRKAPSWRRFARLAGGGVVWTPTTIDTRRTRSTSARARERRSTTRRCRPARTRAPTR